MNYPYESVVINAVLIIVLGFFIKIWINGIKDTLARIDRELNNKVDVATCDRVHKVIDAFAHTHGTAGESIGQPRDSHT